VEESAGGENDDLVSPRCDNIYRSVGQLRSINRSETPCELIEKNKNQVGTIIEDIYVYNKISKQASKEVMK
jgi:hypothetical protein